ncbi:hypothetical protein [Lactococcus garvieae]
MEKECFKINKIIFKDTVKKPENSNSYFSDWVTSRVTDMSCVFEDQGYSI